MKKKAYVKETTFRNMGVFFWLLLVILALYTISMILPMV